MKRDLTIHVAAIAIGVAFLAAIPFIVHAQAPDNHPEDRKAFYGDLHLHTTNSFDAYVLMGTKTTPEQAYQFARGDEIDYLGEKVKRREPLDFLAVTDHSENIGVFNELDDPDSALSKSELGQKIKTLRAEGKLNLAAKRDGNNDVLALLGQLLNPNTLKSIQGLDAPALSSSAWQREIDAANRYYVPGRFTTFIAYEWTSMPSGQNLHRNVIFRGNTAPNPFTSVDSTNPKDLWTWLSKIRGQGYEALAIAHNANASNGLMYDWTQLDGRPIDVAYAVLRQQNEPLSEISQNKGTSETHPSLSPEDEFANFEIFDRLLISSQKSRPSGSYLRDALGKGLVLDEKVGANPYKDGFVGGSDLHGGLSVSSEEDYGGNVGGANIGGGRTTPEAAKALLSTPKDTDGFNVTITAPGSLTGVWAEQNTRESLYDAFRRKETFATSGTRIRVRLFGGWSFAPGLDKAPDAVKTAYATGVPMGSDLPARPAGAGAPSFVVWAVKDPNGANLDRVQIIKIWVDHGQQKERIFDVAFDPRRAHEASGKLKPVGNTVDLKTATYTNTIGSVQLSAVWRDPAFRPDQRAAYYARVLEIPTPRWTTILAVKSHLPLPETVAATLQERAWSSPIWYTPRR
jgi:hypothetical protein